MISRILGFVRRYFEVQRNPSSIGAGIQGYNQIERAQVRLVSNPYMP